MISLVTDYRPETFGRDEFASERLHYKPGQKVVFGGRSQESGKTTLAFKLLEYVATSQMPAYVIVPKPRDPVTLSEGARLHYRFVDRWPVEKSFSELTGDKPSGYIIQAKYGDLEKDQEKAAQIAGAVMIDRYKAGLKGEQSIIVADDTVVISRLLGKDKEMVTIIAMGGAMDVGLWVFVQKPTDAGKTALWAFENAEHTFLAKPRDDRVGERYAEIAGQNKKLIVELLKKLRQYQFLYISGVGEVCIVDSR